MKPLCEICIEKLGFDILASQPSTSDLFISLIKHIRNKMTRANLIVHEIESGFSIEGMNISLISNDNPIMLPSPTQPILSHPFLIFLRKSGKKAETIQTMEKIDMGAGSGNSAIKGDNTVENLAKMLQMPKAVVQRAVGNI